MPLSAASALGALSGERSQIAAYVAAALNGAPVLGSTQSITLSGSDQYTTALTPGAIYVVTSVGGDALIALGGAATTAANQSPLLSGSSTSLRVPLAGQGDNEIHAIQGPTTGGTLYVVQWEG